MPYHFDKYDSKHKAEDLFNIVKDVEKYPEFLPWVHAAKILENHGNFFIAELVVKFKSFSQKYTSRIELTKPSDTEKLWKINVGLVKGPFKHLKTNWVFEPKDNGTQITFELDFRFESILLEKMIGVLFEKAVIRMTDAFIKRADDSLNTSL